MDRTSLPPLLITVLLAVPPDTTSKPPLLIVSLVAVPLENTATTPPLVTLALVTMPPLAT